MNMFENNTFEVKFRDFSPPGVFDVENSSRGGPHPCQFHAKFTELEWDAMGMGKKAWEWEEI